MKILIRYYKLYNIATQFLIFIPVLVNIYLIRGISASQALFIEAVYFITIMIFELPTGYIGDRIGHDKLVVIGLIGTTAGYTLFAFAHNAALVLLAQVLLGISCTCMSGSDLASLSSCMDKNNEKNMISVHKSLYSTGTASLFAAYLASSFVININNDGMLIFLIMAFVHLCSIVFFLLFYRAKQKLNTSIAEKSDPHSSQPSQKSGSTENTLSYFDLLMCGIMLGVISAVYLISQIFYNNLGVDSYYYGIIYCVSSILTIIFTKVKWDFNRKALFALPVLFAVPIFNYKIMIVPFIVLLAYAKALINPFVNNYILSNSKKNKALNVSVSSMINNGINGILMFSLSGIVYALGFTIAMIIFTVISVLIIVYIYHNSSRELKNILNAGIPEEAGGDK